MPFTDSQVRSLEASSKRQIVSVGNSLFVVVYPVKRGGGKYFVGRLRIPPSRTGKQVEIQIGPYGKGLGKWSLKDARDEWVRIRSWSQETGKDPRQLKKEEREVVVEQQKMPTL